MKKINEILISTSNDLFLLKDDETKSLVKGFIYGITWNEYNLFLGCRRSSYMKRQGITVFTKDYKYIKNLNGKDIMDIHQILYHNNKIYLTNTARESIDIIYLNGDPPYRLRYTKETGLHINSVWIKDDILYVLEHRKGDSKVRLLDMKNDFKVINGYDLGLNAHGVYQEDEFIYVCSSFRNKFIRIDVDTRKIEELIDFTEWRFGSCRGIARTKDNWYMGMSQIGGRGIRHTLRGSSVFNFDNDFELIEEKILGNTVGQLNDLRVVDELDYAHSPIPFRKTYK